MKILSWKMDKKLSKAVYFTALLVYIVTLFIQSYFIERLETILLLSSFLLMFLAFVGLSLTKENIDNIWYRYTTVVLHIIPIFALTPLSTDVYRFLWDGEMLISGINPYNFKPSELITEFDSSYLKQLYQNMGELSQGNYSCYPTVNQMYFASAAFFSNSIWINIVVLRLLILGSIVGIYFLIEKQLLKANLKVNYFHFILWNPLFIIESTQNLHFEGVMLFWFLLAIFYLQNGNALKAALFLSFSIHIKLIPILLLPFLLRWIGWKKSLQAWFLTGIFTVLMMLPLLHLENYRNFLESLRLYFQQFEFNSMILKAYIEYGRTRYGYNRIQTFGPQLARYATMFIIVFAWLGNHFSLQKMFIRMLFALVIYYMLASTVHPWYLILPLGISIFTSYRFMLVWSALILLTYVSYGEFATTWMSTIVRLEYGIVGLVILYEVMIFLKRRKVNLDV